MVAPATCSAASSPKLPRNTESWRMAGCSSTESKRHEWSKTASIERCRAGRSRAGTARKSRLLAILSAISWQDNMWVHAAANSRPSDNPSTKWQIRTIASRFCSVSEKPKRWRCAADRNNWTALFSSISAGLPSSGVDKPLTS